MRDKARSVAATSPTRHDPPQPPDTSDGDVESDVTSAVDSEIEVALNRWSIGQIDWPDLVAALAVFVVAALLAYGVRRVIRRSSRNMDGTSATAMSLVSQLILVGIYAFSVAIVLEILGFTLGPVLIIIMLAFVLLIVFRPVIINLSSGLFLQLRGYCRPGDVVWIDGETGRVDEVNARSVVMDTIDGRTVILPNDRVIAGKIINYTRLGHRRSHITPRLGPGADLDAATSATVSALQRLGSVLDDPPPNLVVTGFDGPQMWVEVHYWSEPEIEQEIVARDEVGRALSRLFPSGSGPVDGSSVVFVRDE